MANVSELRKLLVSLDIGQNNALEIFALKRNTLSEMSEKLLKDIFVEFDGSSPIDNVSYKLNLGELQVDDISAKFAAGNTKDIYQSGKPSFKQMLFHCFQ